VDLKFDGFFKVKISKDMKFTEDVRNHCELYLYLLIIDS